MWWCVVLNGIEYIVVMGCGCCDDMLYVGMIVVCLY